MTEKMDEKCEQEPEKEEGLSRRGFLKGIAGAGAALTFGGAETAESKEKSYDMKIYEELIRSKFKKIDYPKSFEPLPDSVKNIIVAVGSYQEGLLQSLGMSGVFEPNKPIRGVKEADPAVLDRNRRKLWEELGKTPAEYDEAHLHSYLLYDLPRALARYGIFTKPIFMPQINKKADHFTLSEALLGFFEIKAVDSEVTEQWGTQIERNIVSIKGPLTLDRKPVNRELLASTTGQTFYRNIFLYEPLLHEEYASRRDDHNKFLTLLPNVNLDALVRHGESPERTRMIAGAVAMVGIAERIKKRGFTAKDVRDNIIAHETTHVIDHGLEEFAALTKLPDTTSAARIMAAIGSASVHEEINGLLGELKYSPRKEIALANALSSIFGYGDGGDFSHIMASDWVVRQLISKINTNAESHGIRINNESHVSRESQIIASLPELLDRDKILQELCDDLMQEHRRNYKEDFSQEYFKYMKWEKKSSIEQNKDLLGKLLGGAAVATLGAYLAREYVKRKNLNRLNQELRSMLDMKKSRQRNIVDNLQLKVKPSQVDEQRRQRALANLRKEVKIVPELEKIIAEVELLSSKRKT